MNVAIAHDAIDTRGGVETYLASIIPALEARGHRVLLVHRRRGAGGSPLARAADAICIDERGLDQALRQLRAWGADVCFSHNMSVLDVDRRLTAEMPVVKMMHGYVGTCASGSKCHAFPSMRACDRTFGTACLALYLPRRCGELRPARLVAGYRHAREQRDLFSRYARMIVASGHMREEYLRHGVPASRLHAVPLFSTIAPAPAGTSAEAATILFAGRMTPLKGGHVLIEAVARLSGELEIPVRLLMVGDGPERGEWMHQARRAGVEAEFPGWIPEESRAGVYRRATVVAVPSLWPEPFGLIGLEAAALGIPAVAFDAGGISAWLRDGSSGTLVPPSAGAHGLSRALADLLRDHPRRDSYGAAAREVARTLSVDAHVSALLDVLQASLPSAAPRPPELVSS